MAGTSTWNEAYSILFKFPSDPSQDQIYGGPKKCLIGRFKQLELNQIHGGPLIELHMIFRPPSTKFKLLKFLNNHSHENSKLANLLWLKNKLLSFPDIFPFFLKRQVWREINYLSFNYLVSIFINDVCSELM